MPRRPSINTQLRSIRRSTRVIARSLDSLGAELRRLERDAKRKPKADGVAKRTLRITPKRRAQLKLQGRYLGFMRQLKPAQKARVKAVKEKRGFEAAVVEAKRVAKAVR